MAYNESTVGGSSQFRVFINNIRTYNGSQAQNYEKWRAEGGIKRIASGTRYWNLQNQATYNIQLGLNGVKKSGNFSYDFGGSSGQQYAWSTSTTTVYRNSAGTGFGFTSRTDINMANSPYLTSGWVTVGGTVSTKPRYGDITAISPSNTAGVTDETSSMSIDWYKRTGRASLWFRLDQIDNGDTTYRYTNVSQDPFIWSGFQTWVQQSMFDRNSTTLYIYYGDDLDSNGSIDRWDSPNTRTLTIANESGQANPTFTSFDYLDTNATTVAITGDDQALIQGKSTLEVTVPVADKATANKNANMQSYSFTVGNYSESETWSNTLDVVNTPGIISDVFNTQDLSVRAIDSRGNSTTVTEQVEILPYADPAFFVGLDVAYTNDFDTSSGITVDLADNTTIGSISPLTLGGTDKNEVPTTPTYGLRFDMAYADDPYTGVWTDIAFTQEAGTGKINVTQATLESQILSKMNAMGADNTERWYVLFELTDKFGPQYYTAVIDVGRPFFRIGADGRLYYKEIEFFQTFSGRSDFYYSAIQGHASIGTNWIRGSVGSVGGYSVLLNPGGADGDEWYLDAYLPAGVYAFNFYLYGDANSGIVDITVNNVVNLVTGVDLYNAGGGTTWTTTSGSITVLDGTTYPIMGTTNGQNPLSGGYQSGLIGMNIERIGNI